MNDYVAFRSPRAEAFMQSQFVELDKAILSAEGVLDLGLIANATGSLKRGFAALNGVYKKLDELTALEAATPEILSHEEIARAISTSVISDAKRILFFAQRSEAIARIGPVAV